MSVLHRFRDTATQKRFSGSTQPYFYVSVIMRKAKV